MEQFQQPIQQTNTAESSVAYRTLFRNVYLWMTLALVITGITSYLVASSPAILHVLFGGSLFLFYGLVIGVLALVWYLSSRINQLSIGSATGFFILYSVLNGVVISSIFLAYTSTSIAFTFFITAGTFAAMALIGTLTNKDLSSWGSFLMMALVGVIIASIANFFMKSEAMYWVISYVGVLLFLGLTIYDANKIKRALQTHGHEVNDTTQKIALMGALSLYLDFINLFLFLLRIFGGRK